MIHIHFFWRRTAQCCLAALLLVATAHAAAATPGIAAGGQHALALQADGSMWAWGDNGSGQLGDGTTDYRPSPVRVLAPGSGAISIAAGKYYSLALQADGSVWAWGDNNWGQLGDGWSNGPDSGPEKVGLGSGAQDNRSSPLQVLASGSGVISITAGQEFIFALKKDGSVWAWGYNSADQLGPLTPERHTGRPQFSSRSPFQLLSARSGMTSIVAGRDFALALQADGSIWGWGSNERGQLGDGPGRHQWPPVQVVQPQALDSHVIALAAGGWHALALQADGSVWAWGFNDSGQLGDGTAINRSAPVRVLAPGSGAVAVAAADNHSLVLTADGSVWAWGINDGGQLGDGTAINRSAPVRVLAPGSGAVAVAAAGNHSLALKADGSVWTWGDHRKIMSGPATAAAKPVPTRMPGFSLSAGEKR